MRWGTICYNIETYFYFAGPIPAGCPSSYSQNMAIHRPSLLPSRACRNDDTNASLGETRPRGRVSPRRERSRGDGLEEASRPAQKFNVAFLRLASDFVEPAYRGGFKR